MKKSLLLFVLAFNWNAGADRVTDLRHLIQHGLDNAAQLAVSQTTEQIADRQIELEKTQLYPSVSLSAIDSTGFAGSSSIGEVTGIPSSPYREGWGYGVFVKEKLYDFGKTGASIRAAQEGSELAKKETENAKVQVAIQVSEVYFTCALFKTKIARWNEIVDSIRKIEREVDHFVRAGKRSVVERDLASAQTNDLLKKIADAKAGETASLDRLENLVGLKANSISCAELKDGEVEATVFGPALEFKNASPPVVEMAKAQLRISEEEETLSRRQENPELFVSGGLGNMENSRVVDVQDYSAAIGISVPIWDGNKTHEELRIARLKRQRGERQISATRQNFRDVFLSLSQTANRARARLVDLQHEKDAAERAFRLSRSRYLSYAGGLSDFREAVRNLESISAEFYETEAQLFTALVTEKLMIGEQL